MGLSGAAFFFLLSSVPPFSRYLHCCPFSWYFLLQLYLHNSVEPSLFLIQFSCYMYLSMLVKWGHSVSVTVEQQGLSRMNKSPKGCHWKRQTPEGRERKKEMCVKGNQNVSVWEKRHARRITGLREREKIKACFSSWNQLPAWPQISCYHGDLTADAVSPETLSWKQGVGSKTHKDSLKGKIAQVR